MVLRFLYEDWKSEPMRLIKDDQQITLYALKCPEARADDGECHINLAIATASGLAQG